MALAVGGSKGEGGEHLGMKGWGAIRSFGSLLRVIWMSGGVEVYQIHTKRLTIIQEIPSSHSIFSLGNLIQTCYASSIRNRA